MKKRALYRHKISQKVSKKPKLTTIATYTGVFLFIMSVVAMGYSHKRVDDSNASIATTNVVSNNYSSSQPSVDQMVSTNVVANIAERADLPIAPNVANLSVSLSVKDELSQDLNSSTITKPQIVNPSVGNREIKNYTSKAGDTSESIAKQFDISVTTLKSANNLSSDAVEPNSQMIIPPVDGVVYTVKDGDTIDSIASKYQSDKDSIVSYNDLEISGVKEGSKIILPGGVLPETERPGYVAPVPVYNNITRQNSNQSAPYIVVKDSSIARASSGNKYAFGNCTWYAYERRAQLGRPIGSFWGNGAEWDNSAIAAGLTVNNIPKPGSIQGMEGGAGHVAIVEEVYPDGSIRLSEMNYAGNFNRVTSRTMNAGEASRYKYIH